jgi:hypothetical protein
MRCWSRSRAIERVCRRSDRRQSRPDASRASADAALTAAADAADQRHTPELLAEIEHTG